MRIVSLEPFVTDIVNHCKGGEALVGVTHLCTTTESARHSIVTTSQAQTPSCPHPDDERLAAGLSRFPIRIDTLKELAPDLIFTNIVATDADLFIPWAHDLLRRYTTKHVSIKNTHCSSLQQMYELVEGIAGSVGRAREGRELANRAKAQMMAWADSFFDRCKGKRVVVLSSVAPLRTATCWIPDLIRLMSAKPFLRDPSRKKMPLEWGEIVDFQPDVIVVGITDEELTGSVTSLSLLQSLPRWDDLPAVKRGEVIFASGDAIYRAGPYFARGAAAIVSAIAGLDSGYITQRDEYYKIRYLELYRHRFGG